MKTPSIVLAVSATLMITGCATKLSSRDQVITFGVYHGMCRSHCSDMYQLRGNELVKDTTDYLLRGGQGRFDIRMPASSFEEAQSIRSLIPASISSGQDSTYGCPDCADQGGVYLQLQGSKTITIRMDTQDSQLPEHLKPLAQRTKLLASRFRQIGG